MTHSLETLQTGVLTQRLSEVASPFIAHIVLHEPVHHNESHNGDFAALIISRGACLLEPLQCGVPT